MTACSPFSLRPIRMACLTLALLAVGLTGATPAMAEEAPVPTMPKPIESLAAQGAQVRYMGKAQGLDSWLTIQRGQEQYFYVLPGGEAFLMGLLFNKDGKLITVEQINALRKDSGVVQFVGFASPKADPTVQDPKFKQAISMAIDRELVIKTIFNGERDPLDGWVAAKAVGDFQAGACGDYCKFDAAKAKAKLAEVPTAPKSITISYNADSAHKVWVDATCQSITNTLGVACQGAPSVDFKTFLDALKARQTKGMYRYGWQMDYPSPENFLVPIYSKGASSNYNDYDNPAFDAKLKEAASAKTAAEGYKLYYDAEKMLADNMPVVPLWGSSARAGWSTKVTNVKIDAFGRPDYRAVKLK